MPISLTSPLSEAKGVGPSFLEKLSRLGIATVKDLLYHFPFRYQDFSKISSIAELREGDTATIYAQVKKIRLYRTFRRRMFIVDATLSDDSGDIKAVWFNQKYLITILKEGTFANFAGKVASDKKHFILQNPVYELLSGDNSEGRHTGRLVPIYPETKGITSRALRLILDRVVRQIKEVAEFLPPPILKKYRLPRLFEAFRFVHFPRSIAETERGEERFAFQDLFLLQLLHASEKHDYSLLASHIVPYDPEEIKTYFSRLPFTLTLSQKKALYEILEDLKKPHATNRLLQGDVGSGKTIVAAIAALNAARHGLQTAFMAPTEILAVQHYNTIKKFFPEFSDGVALFTSGHRSLFFGHGLETETARKGILDAIKGNRAKIIIGTHAVIQKSVAFHDVSLVVVDEQHRFGVAQRAALSAKKGSFTPHLLSMSATPIPRTLALALFGDLELSLITELPENRKPITTKMVPPAQRDAAYRFIRKEIEKGRQAFVICPRIEPPDPEKPLSRRQLFQLETKSAKEEYEKLSQKIFSDLSVGLLHGRLTPREKTETMRLFKEGKTDILVSTSVVEVGVDVPNATIMMIEGADRFGLSQLYQFRGRVGRGEHASYCFLFTEISSKTVFTRLRAIASAKNGMALAELDLKLRGPGEFLGKEQTGLPDTAMKALRKPELTERARKEAFALIEKDPKLSKFPYLAAYLAHFKKEVYLE